MPRTAVAPNLQRDTLRKVLASKSASDLQKRLAALRLAYSEDHKLLTGSINQLIGKERIYPRHYPGQASGRTSTIDPPITNWPRACINQACQARLHADEYFKDELGYIEHEWTEVCWSIRDIQLPDIDEILVVHDHDNIEGKIHDLVVEDATAIEAHKEGYDLHTITCCDIFGYVLPCNLRNPHTSVEDTEWRSRYRWQGKDTKQRVLAKNFNHGSKYARNERFVYRISGIEKYGINYTDLGKLAKRYIEFKGDAWKKKLEIMDHIRRSRIARSLYGFRRVFFDSSEDTGKEGFSHVISATVADFNNHTIDRFHEWLGEDIRLIHNAHDGDKFAIKQSVTVEWGNVNNSMDQFRKECTALIERPIEYKGRSLVMTAGIKVYV